MIVVAIVTVRWLALAAHAFQYHFLSCYDKAWRCIQLSGLRVVEAKSTAAHFTHKMQVVIGQRIANGVIQQRIPDDGVHRWNDVNDFALNKQFKSAVNGNTVALVTTVLQYIALCKSRVAL